MLETSIRVEVSRGGGNQNKITRRTISRKPNESFHVRIAGNLVPRRRLGGGGVEHPHSAGRSI